MKKKVALEPALPALVRPLAAPSREQSGETENNNKQT
jgi:hypothetical protein